MSEDLAKKELLKVNIAIIVMGVSAGIAGITRSLLLSIPGILATLYVYSKRSVIKAEKQRREHLTYTAFAIGLLIPIFVIMALFIFLAVLIITKHF